MRDQHLYQGPAIDMSMDTADYYNPDLGYLVDILRSGIENLPAWQGIWAHNLRS